MLEARPDRPFWGRPWVESAFTAHLPGFGGPDGSAGHSLDGWSVGGCMGAETLVQSRPLARATDNPVNDLLRSGARCSLGLFHSTPEGAPPSTDPPRTGRFRRWMAVVAGQRLPESSRAEILGDLPAFLARDAARSPDCQLQLLALLHKLYTATGFQNAYAEPTALAAAIADFADSRGEEAPDTMMLSDGRTLGLLVRRGCLLSSYPPADLRPTRGLVASPDHLPASLWIWNPDAPTTPSRDAERLSEGVFTVTAAEPGNVTRL